MMKGSEKMSDYENLKQELEALRDKCKEYRQADLERVMYYDLQDMRKTI